jgi:hypothetical protein
MKLEVNKDFRKKFPSYAQLKLGDVVRIINPGIKKYISDPLNGKLAIVIGYGIGTGVVSRYAIRLVDDQREMLIYDYRLEKTRETVYVPKFDKGEQLKFKAKPYKGKWIEVLEPKENQKYLVKIISQDEDYEKQFETEEKNLRHPKKDELEFKSLKIKLPEFEGIL